MGNKSFHLCMDIKGFLMRASKREYKNLFTSDDGRTMSPDEAKRELLDRLSKGENFIPFGNCDNFDPVKDRCRGHEVQDSIQGGRQHEEG